MHKRVNELTSVVAINRPKTHSIGNESEQSVTSDLGSARSALQFRHGSRGER